MKARAPNLLFVGSHVRLVKKLKPAWVKAGHAWLVVKKAIRTRMASTSSPQIKATTRKPLSATLRWLAWSVGCGSSGLRTAVMVIDLPPPRGAGRPRRPTRRGDRDLGNDDLIQLGRRLLQQRR